MKRLILFRHSKTEPDAPNGKDFDRRLTHDGRRDAERMGQEMRGLGLHADRIIASTARRAVETAEGAGLTAEPDLRIYNASAGELMAVAEGTEDTAESLMIIGHNPGLERLASRMLGAPIAMPTGSLIEIELVVESWAEAGGAAGRAIRFVKPKELR